MINERLRQITWIGSSLDDLKKFPKSAQQEAGFNLYRVQEGKMPQNVKPLNGLGSGIMEIITDYNKNTYRSVFVLNLGDDIYVLHVFQKKSKTGIKTPKQEIELIKRRLLIAKSIVKQREAKRGDYKWIN
jgi:phage-related protein